MKTKPLNFLKVQCASPANCPDAVHPVHGRPSHRPQRSSTRRFAGARFTSRAVPALLGLLVLGVLTATAQPQFGFVGSFKPLVEFDNNIRQFPGVLEQSTNVTLTVTQTDATHYTASLSEGANSLTITNLLQTGNRIQNQLRPVPLPSVNLNLLDFIMLSDGTNRAFVHVAQETNDPDDVSFMVASWSSYTGRVTVADFVGTWDIEAYSDSNLRNGSNGFDYDLLTTSLAQVDADHIGLLLLNIRRAARPSRGWEDRRYSAP